MSSSHVSQAQTTDISHVFTMQFLLQKLVAASEHWRPSHVLGKRFARFDASWPAWVSAIVILFQYRDAIRRYFERKSFAWHAQPPQFTRTIYCRRSHETGYTPTGINLENGALIQLILLHLAKHGALDACRDLTVVRRSNTDQDELRPTEPVTLNNITFDYHEQQDSRENGGFDRTAHTVQTMCVSANTQQELVAFFESLNKDENKRESERRAPSKHDTPPFVFELMPNSDGSGSGRVTYKRMNLVCEPRTFDRIFFDQKTEFLKLLNHFEQKTGPWRKELQRSNKLVVLLEGPPGTGKTSVIKALQARTKRDVFKVRFSRVKDSLELNDIFFSGRIRYYDHYGDVSGMPCFPCDRLLVLEDIDATDDREVVSKSNGDDLKSGAPTDTVHVRRHTPHLVKELYEKMTQRGPDSVPLPVNGPDDKKKEPAITLSDVLNVLDGVMEPTGCIIVMTTNYVEKLDKALTRPVRVDIRLHMGYMSKLNLHEMLKALYGETCAWPEDVPFPDDLTPAALQYIAQSCETAGEVMERLKLLKVM